MPFFAALTTDIKGVFVMSKNIQKMWSGKLSKFIVITMFLLLPIVTVKAQGYGDRTRTGGTGGVHSIQGRINFPSDRPATTFRVKLESTNSATLTTFSNSEGIFYFNSLEPSHYTVIVETGDDYAPIRETVYIDREIVSSMGQTFNVVFQLRPKGTASNNPRVISASLAKVPKPALEQFKKAIEAVEKNDTKLAIEKLSEAVRLYPQFAEAYSELGSLYLKSGELSKAEEALRKTLQLNEKNPTAQLNYGIVLLNQRKMYEAEKQLEKAVLADENAAIPHMYLGIALLGLDYPDYAEKEFLKAISLRDDEKLAQSHRYLGGIYWKKGKYKQAIDELEKYLKFLPKAADAEKVRVTIGQLREKIK
jgi:Tfp pilus assembly protein PilF